MNQSETRQDRVRGASLVRPSRDGDQFHYLWAARRCLLLLSPEQDLVGVSIEGVSPDETSQEPADPAGDTVIDVAEYYGYTDRTRALRIRYLQLKHSSHRTQEAWTASRPSEDVERVLCKVQEPPARIQRRRRDESLRVRVCDEPPHQPDN